MAIKVLPLDDWMELEDWCVPNDQSWPRKTIECDPVFNRPGWYYNRIEKKSWFERPSGTAFSYPSKYFLERLKEIEVCEIDKKTALALQVLVNAKLATKEQQELLSDWYIQKECWKIRWGTYKCFVEND